MAKKVLSKVSTKIETLENSIAFDNTYVSTPSLDTLITALNTSGSSLKISQQLEARIAVRKAELEQLYLAQQALELQVPKPIITNFSITSNSVILKILKNAKKALALSDIYTKIVALGYLVEQKKLTSCVSSLTKNGKISKTGQRGRFKYRVV